MLQDEPLISLLEAAQRLPQFGRGQPVHPATIWRWIRVGVRLNSGDRVRLEALRLGSRYVTSIEAIGRFIERQQREITDTGAAHLPALRTKSERQRATEQAERRLDEIGV